MDYIDNIFNFDLSNNIFNFDIINLFIITLNIAVAFNIDFIFNPDYFVNMDVHYGMLRVVCRYPPRC